ncbi:MAG: carboxymuconolactone decarboxylase family protein [Alphaproteobacteria bacterium]
MAANSPVDLSKVKTHRANYFAAAPKVVQAMMQLSGFVNGIGLEKPLQELVKIRSSQINGCAFCLHIHSRAARALGETEERLHVVAAWRESALYTARERAALAWTECLTRLAEQGAPDDVYHALAAEFTDAEQAELTLLINTVNAWNRFAVGFRSVYPSESADAAAA